MSEYSPRATRGYLNLPVFPRFKIGGSGSRKLRVQEVSAGLPWFVAHASRGREPSYSGLFSIYESFWSWLNLRGCLDGV